MLARLGAKPCANFIHSWPIRLYNSRPSVRHIRECILTGLVLQDQCIRAFHLMYIGIYYVPQWSTTPTWRVFKPVSRSPHQRVISEQRSHGCSNSSHTSVMGGARFRHIYEVTGRRPSLYASLFCLSRFIAWVARTVQ